jgi:Fic-DOC domain mobile mystery protein B
MADIFDESDNSTPLTDEEKEGLKAKWLTTRAELNELETQGILNAQTWLMTNKKNILSVAFIKTLHKKMFSDVWVWAGKFRMSERNIGISPYLIQENLKVLLDDVDFWIKNETFPPKEIAVRFHHRLVQIHPFPNGNGRFSRLVADLLMKSFGLPALNWGSNNLAEISEVRKNYILALKYADSGDYQKLLDFVK